MEMILRFFISGKINGIMGASITYYPKPKYKAECTDCGWAGDFSELGSVCWEHYSICPECGSDEIKTIVYKINLDTWEWERYTNS